MLNYIESSKGETLGWVSDARPWAIEPYLATRYVGGEARQRAFDCPKEAQDWVNGL